MQHIHFKKILVPTDFSDTARRSLEHVKWLAQTFYSEVTLIHVGEIVPALTVFPSLYLPETGLPTDYQELARTKLNEWREMLITGGLQNVKTHYTEGNVASSINEYAIEEKMDIVVMGTHGSKGLTGFFMGSNAFKLVNMIDLPVLTVNNKRDFTPYKKIVTPLDASLYSRAKFPYIAELAAITGAEVEILYPEIHDRHEKHALDICYEQVSSFLTKRSIKFNGKSIEGNLAHETIKYAEYANADLIVIMSETETTISQMLLGGNAQEVVNHSKIPVITLHPEDKGEMMDLIIMPGT